MSPNMSPNPSTNPSKNPSPKETPTPGVQNRVQGKRIQGKPLHTEYKGQTHFESKWVQTESNPYFFVPPLGKRKGVPESKLSPR